MPRYKPEGGIVSSVSGNIEYKKNVDDSLKLGSITISLQNIDLTGKLPSEKIKETNYHFNVISEGCPMDVFTLTNFGLADVDSITTGRCITWEYTAIIYAIVLLVLALVHWRLRSK